MSVAGGIVAAMKKLAAVFERLEALALGKVSATVHRTTLEFVRNRFAQDVKRNFGEAQSPDGRRWAPLKYRSGMPLILTGTLLRAAVDAMRTAKFDGRAVIIGMSGTPKYWGVHQYGWRRVPARPYFGARAETVAELADTIADAVSVEIVHAAKTGQQQGL